MTFPTRSMRILASAVLSASALCAYADVKITDYGAIPNDSIDDRQAIQNAIAASTNGERIVVPPGVYRLNSGLTVTGRDLTLVGSGDQAAVFELHASNATLLDVSFSAPNAKDQNVTIRDLTLRTVGTANTAVRITYPDPESTHTDPGPLLENLHIESSGAGNWWESGIHLTHAWNTKIRGCFLSNEEGSIPPYRGVAIRVHRRSVNSIISDTSLSWWQTGVLLEDQGGTKDEYNNYINHEGTVISNCPMVPVFRGVEAKDWSPSRAHWLSVTSSHIDARGELCMGVYVDAGVDVILKSNSIYITPGADSRLGWHACLNVYRGVVSGNTFVTISDPSDPVGGGGVVILGDGNHPLYRGGFVRICDNVFDGCLAASWAVWLQPGSSQCSASDNLFANSPSTYLDQGTNNQIP